jgi:hypothetical protein
MSQPYCVVIGPAWYPAVAWKRAHGGRPFVGVRVDTDTRNVWVLGELVLDGRQLPIAEIEAIERAANLVDLSRSLLAKCSWLRLEQFSRVIRWRIAFSLRWTSTSGHRADVQWLRKSDIAALFRRLGE